MILNDGVEDTVRFRADYRARVAVINALEYEVWKLGLVICDQIGRGVFSKGLECSDVLADYLSMQKDKYMYVQHHT